MADKILFSTNNINTSLYRLLLKFFNFRNIYSLLWRYALSCCQPPLHCRSVEDTSRTSNGGTSHKNLASPVHEYRLRPGTRATRRLITYNWRHFFLFGFYLFIFYKFHAELLLENSQNNEIVTNH